MKTGFRPVAFVLVCGLLLSTQARATNYNDKAAGNWNSSSTWDSSPSGGTYPQFADDTAVIDSHQVTVPTDYSLIAVSNISISTGGELYFYDDSSSKTTTNTSPVTLAGDGTITKHRYHTLYQNADITVTGGTNIINAGVDHSMFLNGQLKSTTSNCKIIKRDSAIYWGGLQLNQPSPNYSGDLEVQLGNLYMNTNGCLGAGNVIVDGAADDGNGVYLHIYSDQTNTAGPNVTIKNGAILYPGETSAQHQMDWTNNPTWTFDNAKLLAYHAGVTIYNRIYLTNTSELTPTYWDIDFVGNASGPGAIRLQDNEHTGKPRLRGTNSTYSGGTLVAYGGYATQAPEGTNAGALGTGPITVVTNSILYLQDENSATNWTLPNDLRGGGTIKVEDGSGNYTLTCQGGAASPGTNAVGVTTNSTGMLGIWSAFAFGKQGSQFSQLNIEIAGTNNVAGIDYDRLAVSNNCTGLSSANLIVVVSTNLDQFSSAIVTQVFDIVTCANNLSGLAFNSVTWSNSWNGSVGYSNGYVRLYDLYMGPAISNDGGASNITETAATLNGNLTSTGGVPTCVYVYYGTTDGTNGFALWEHTNNLGTNATGFITNQVPGLTANTKYYYRFYATNSASGRWASPTASFRTLGGAAAVNNGNGATNIATVEATLTGDLTGGSSAEVYVYWGTTDGGTGKSSWANVITNGTLSEGAFSNNITGLYYGLRYYYRCYASNAYGQGWAETTTNFVTSPATGLGITNGLQLWLKADSITGLNHGDPVYSWQDLSGSGTNGTNVGTITYQTNSIGGKPAVSLPGTSDNYLYLGVQRGGARSLWVVAQLAASQVQYSGIWGDRDASPADGHYTDGADYLSESYAGAGYYVANGATWYENGTQMSDPRTESLKSYPVIVDAETGAAVYYDDIGRGNQAGRNLNAKIAEVIVYDRVLTSDERDYVGGYLGNKYGLTTVYNYSGAPAQLANTAASNLTATSATLGGTFSCSGCVYSVWVWWNMADCGTNKGTWANSLFVGTYTNLVATTDISRAVSGLVPDSTYYYRFYASNAAGSEAWAYPSSSFTTPVPPDFSSWNYKMKITFSGYDKAETLTNFPALVVFNTTLTNFSYATFKSSTGGDLRFTDSTATNRLYYEMEEWNTNGNSYMWVRVPVLTNNAYIWAYWGYVGILSPPAYTTNGSTWSADFGAVWHMRQTNAVDSTTNNNNGQAVGGVTQMTTGQISSANTFNGTTGYVRVPDSASLRVFPNGITVSFWLKANNASGIPISRWGSGPDSGYGLYNDTWYEGNTGWNTMGAGRQSDNLWHFYAWTGGGSQMLTYRDGATNQTGTYVGGTFPTVTWLAIATDNRSLGGTPLAGSMDEVRVENFTRSSNWVWACWMNMSSNTTFNGYGAVQRVSGLGSLYLFR